MKQYAKAKRDYEVGKGFTMRNALEELVDNSLMALRDVEFTDSNGRAQIYFRIILMSHLWWSMWSHYWWDIDT